MEGFHDGGVAAVETRDEYRVDIPGGAVGALLTGGGKVDVS